MRSTERLWTPEARARKRLTLVPNTILATMRHGCSIQTATISRSFIKAEFDCHSWSPSFHHQLEQIVGFAQGYEKLIARGQVVRPIGRFATNNSPIPTATAIPPYTAHRLIRVDSYRD